MKFYHGEIDGTGHTSRSGTMSTGLKVQAHSKQGSVVVQLSESAGITHAKVYLTKNPKTGKGTESVVYDGPVSGYNEPDVVLRFPSKQVREVTLPDPEILTDEQVTQPFVSFFNLPAEPEFIGGNVVNPPPLPFAPHENFDQPVKVSILPPVQRRIQHMGTAPIVRAIAQDLAGTLTPAGDDIEETESEWVNDAQEARGPRVSFGKLRILPDPSD